MSTKIGEEIKTKRLKKGLTQATISNLENKDRIPTMSILLKLADRLDIELDAVLEYALDRELGHNQLKMFMGKQIKKLFLESILKS